MNADLTISDFKPELSGNVAEFLPAGDYWGEVYALERNTSYLLIRVKLHGPDKFAGRTHTLRLFVFPHGHLDEKQELRKKIGEKMLAEIVFATTGAPKDFPANYNPTDDLMFKKFGFTLTQKDQWVNLSKVGPYSFYENVSSLTPNSFGQTSQPHQSYDGGLQEFDTRKISSAIPMSNTSDDIPF